ncbi:hypothetical protein NAI45_11710, partial [Francisella tularensis subsp. holarctica]|nr:hypothetical protein [Francisella tularensis subsp. holarctica]
KIAPNIQLRAIVNITADISEKIVQLEESISEIHTRKLNKEIKKQVQGTKNRFNQKILILKTQLKRLNMFLKHWHTLNF